VKVTALYPGSFDPFHNGHLDIAMRALELFEEVVIGVYGLPNKNLLFDHQERIGLVEACMAEQVRSGRLRVVGYGGLTVEFARSIGARAMIRGLRNSVDFDYELQMSQTNHWLAADIESVFLFANTPHSFLSATLVREITQLGGDVTALVPSCVAEALAGKRGERGEGRG
jgi:pantetheine-phosphate adenylyltransferase